MEIIALIILIGIFFLTYKYIRNRTTERADSTEWDFLEEDIVANLAGPGTYSLDIVGESYYQRALEEICGPRKVDGENKIVLATLILDDNNPHDNKAVRVDINGKTVGHLSRENARKYRQELSNAGYPNITASCSAMIVGGWDRGSKDRGHYGVKLDLPTTDDFLSEEDDDAELDEYFNLLNSIVDSQKRKNYDEMLKACNKTIPLLNELVKATKKSYGSFDITSIPAIEIGSRYWAVLGMRDKLSLLQEAISNTPELNDGWRVVVQKSLEDADLTDKIKVHIKNNPGVLQNKLGKALDVSGRDTSRIINTLQNLQLIKRIPSGKTYKLYMD